MTAPAWKETGTGETYRDPARGIHARIWPLFHGGYCWYVMRDQITVGRGGGASLEGARTSANTALTFVEDSR